MEQISKTVHARLAAHQNATEHPDADLLTAYAENVLAARERDVVVAHLARCPSCRDLVLLATPDTVAAPQVGPALAPKRKWFARPVLGWLGAAAAIVVVGTAVTLRQSHQQPRTETYTVATSQAPAPAPTPSASPSSTTETDNRTDKLALNAEPAASAKKAQPNRDGLVYYDAKGYAGESYAAKPDATRSRQADEQLRANLAKQPQKLQYQNAIDVATGVNTSKRNNVTAALAPPPPPPPLHNAPIKAAQSNAVTVAQLPASPSPAEAKSETVSVEGAAPQIETATNLPVADAGVVPKSKDSAKLARPAISPNTGMSTMRTGAVGGAVMNKETRADYEPGTQNVICSLIADGVRCIQDKRTREMHQPAANLKVIASQGSVIWVGGDALLRSIDGGASWIDVKKPSTEAIAQIVVMPEAVYIRTASGAMWKTADNGLNWAQASATK